MGKQRRRPRRTGRLFRRWPRELVRALPSDAVAIFDGNGDRFDWFDGEDGEGSAGVREPRRPKPLGPMSGAGERPFEPEPLFARLPDPRY